MRLPALLLLLLLGASCSQLRHDLQRRHYSRQYLKRQRQARQHPPTSLIKFR